MTDPDTIQKGISRQVEAIDENKEMVENCNPEQIALIRNYAVQLGQSEREISKKMGLNL